MSSREPRPGSSTAPVESGESHHIQIEELGREGDGIGYVNGFVIIVPGTGLGDWVTVELDEVHDTFAVASVVDESTVGETGTRLR